MFLNRLVNIAKSPTNLRQLTNIFQKCSISTTQAICAKFEVAKSQDLWNTQKDPNPVDRINEKLKTNEVGRLFAVVQLCGKQFIVTPGDIILVEGYWEPSNGDELRLDKVLVAGSQDFSIIGRPALQRGLVDIRATVIEKSLSHTRTVFKKKRRKQYMRINFQRMQTTTLRINSIDFTKMVEQKKNSIADDRDIY